MSELFRTEGGTVSISSGALAELVVRATQVVEGARVQSDRPAIESNFINVFNRKTLAVDQQRIHSSNDIANSPPKLGGVPSAARRGGSKENHPVFAHFF